MKIKSLSNSNLVTFVSGARVVIPAKGFLELPDAKFAGIAAFVDAQASNGNLEWVSKPVKSKEEEAADRTAKIAAARALLKEVDAKPAKKAGKDKES